MATKEREERKERQDGSSLSYVFFAFFCGNHPQKTPRGVYAASEKSGIRLPVAARVPQNSNLSPRSTVRRHDCRAPIIYQINKS
ncbi:MAG: hypothetical protein QOF48_839 [Verrucomicrobiota bacterium]|jgi:hypothetical protein